MPSQVVAALKSRNRETGEVKSINLIADGDVAKQVDDLLKKQARVSVVGEESADGIKVKEIHELPARKKPDNK